MMSEPGEQIHARGGQRLRVLAVIPFKEEDESPLLGLSQVEELCSRGSESQERTGLVPVLKS